MNTKLLEYKCPCCGGAISFDSTLQKMKCPFCGTEFETETLKSFDEELKTAKESDLNWEAGPENAWREGEQTGMRIYSCQSCGGEIVADETTAATSCPYCGNPVIMTGQFTDTLKPDYIIPFKKDKKAAKEAMYHHFKGKVLLPKVFKDENHIDEIKGVYVPYWLFGCKSDADVRYDATKVRAWSDSKYDYVETLHYLVTREGNLCFEHIPVDGSKRMADDLMESIEPYQFSDAVEFQTAYLSGYFADRYDVNADDCMNRAGERVKTSTEQALASTIMGYASVVPRSSNVRLNDKDVKYALYPVWILNTNWKGKKYIFAMNGQTGKLVGDLPMDKGKFWKLFFLLFLGIGALTSLLMILLM